MRNDIGPFIFGRDIRNRLDRKYKGNWTMKDFDDELELMIDEAETTGELIADKEILEMED